MKSFLNMLLCLVAVLGIAPMAYAADAAPPPTQGPVYATTYFEVTPGNAGQAVEMLKEYRAAARMEGGATSVQIFQEAAVPSRFVAHEVWRDWAAYDAHTKGAARNRAYLRTLPIQYGPPDVRAHLAHYSGPQAGPTANSVFVISHLDVTPNTLPRLMELMKPLGEGTLKDPGVQTYQILRQAPGTGNHFRLYEIWASERAWDAHNLAAHTQEFRTELATLLGTPYDQRRYMLVN